MKKIKQLFHVLSYMQYPFLLLGLILALKPYFKGFDYLKSNPEYFFSVYNKVLIFLGVALSFSTLQDSNKTSLKFERKIYSNPRKARFFIILTMIVVLVLFIYGFIGYLGLNKQSNVIYEFSSGSIILGIGLIGYLKLQIEIFDNLRADKKEQSTDAKPGNT